VVWKLAWRSLWRNRRRTLIALSSIAFGLTLAIFFISLSAGIHKQVIDDATRMLAGHLALEHPLYRDAPAPDLRLRGVAALVERIGSMQAVRETKRLVLAQAVVATGAGSSGVSLMGIEPEREARSSPLARKLVKGRYLLARDERGVVVGRALAERLALEPDKKLVVTLSDPNGEMIEELLRVVGVFDTGADAIDGFVVQVPLPVAQRLLGFSRDEVTQLGVVLRSPDDLAHVRDELAMLSSEQALAVRTWQEMMPELSGWHTLDGGINRVLCGAILALVLFTILNTLMMSALERSREFGVLLSLGTPPGTLRLQLMVEAALLGALGCFSGGLLGSLAGYAMEVRGLDLHTLTAGQSVGGFAFDARIRADLTLHQLVALSTLIFGATIMLSIYPTLRATRVTSALHHSR
jgi:ABC-type lipoprotein release transport system permease subunit